VTLDAGVVERLVGEQFPELGGLPVRRLGAGWDNELFGVGPEWILRFPRRAERVPWLVREIEIMRVVGDALGGLVPRFELLGEPSAVYPWPFVGYRRVAGVGADQNPALDLPGLAGDVGAVLGRLHRIDPAEIPATPAGWEWAPWGELRAELAAVAGSVRPLLAPGLLGQAEPYLAGRVAEPEQDGARRFIHNDICPDHIITSTRTGRLAGLIDFTDVRAGEPVLDFVGLIGIAGYEFIGQVMDGYDLGLEPGFTGKLEWLARTLTLRWLAEAAGAPDATEADVRKLRSWVVRAFAGP
jgi:aminoglycoside phosphotransferase (APT) family kinase protein